MYRKFQRGLLLTVILATVLGTTGCSLIPLKDTTQTNTSTKDENAADSLASDDNLLYTTNDSKLTITLPDKNWFNIADADSRRTFICDKIGILTIDHSTGGYADVTTIPSSENDLEKQLTSKTKAAAGDEENEGALYTLVDSQFSSTDVAESFYYEVAYPEGNKTRYEIVWGMKAPEELYEAIARSYTADEATIDKIRTSVKSIQVLGGNYDGIVRTTGAIDTSETITTKNRYRCTQSANVRDAATNQSNVIGTVESGETIDVLNQTGNWFEFKYDGETAYVYSKFFEAAS
ncbi:MAG: SH3 domain-containing protein [Lachnospiraceae bacterium]|nr:SH3 domain-containing protein [Lachnospiraceae bacterium]